MTEDKIKHLLQKADETAGPPVPVSVDLSSLRRRLHRRRLAYLAAPLAAAAVILVALTIWTNKENTLKTTPDHEKIVALEAQLKQLQARTDATLNLVQQVLDQERKQSRLNELKAQLAGIPDPIEQLNKQVDRTAFILIYRANCLYDELNQTESAIQAYKLVIKLFPENQWAQVAREKLDQIQNKKLNKQI